MDGGEKRSAGSRVGAMWVGCPAALARRRTHLWCLRSYEAQREGLRVGWPRRFCGRCRQMGVGVPSPMVVPWEPRELQSSSRHGERWEPQCAGPALIRLSPTPVTPSIELPQRSLHRAELSLLCWISHTEPFSPAEVKLCSTCCFGAGSVPLRGARHHTMQRSPSTAPSCTGNLL